MMPLNPYIAGNPVGGTPNFVGRADVLREVLRVLRHPAQNAIVLYGQRRIGKTSILQQLAAQLPNEGPYHSVYFDLQDKAAWPLGRVLVEIARTIAYALNQPDPDASASSAHGSGEDPVKTFRDTWLPDALDALSEQTQSKTPSVTHSLVLLFDEFDVLADPKGGQAGADLFPYLRELMTLDPARLQFVFVIGRKVEDLESIALSLFKGTRALRISLLSKKDTVDLIHSSESNKSLKWSPDAVEKVWGLTHGHPFLTQQVCSRVWDDLYDTDPTGIPIALQEDVEAVIPDTLETSRNSMQWIWDGLPPAERVVISALAEAGEHPISQNDLEHVLQESGVRVVIRELQSAPQLLQEWDLIEPVQDGYRFRVELLRLWILEHKPLRRVQEELDRIEPLAENLYQAAAGFFRSNQLENALNLLRQAIGLNPNHLRARQLLAEILMLQGEIDEALQILQSLYDTQPAIARPRLIQAFLIKADEESIQENKLTIYQQILKIDPSHPEASRKANEINLAIRQQSLALKLTEVAKLENEKRYNEALDLTQTLASEYTNECDWQPEIERLERHVQLAKNYQRALGALQSGDSLTAKQLLIDVILLEPDYEEASRYLHKAITGVDIAEIEKNLEKERISHQKTQQKVTQIEKEVETLQKKLNQEQASHKKTKTRLTQLEKPLKSVPETSHFSPAGLLGIVKPEVKFVEKRLGINQISAISVSPNEKHLCVSGKTGFRLYEVEGLKEVWNLPTTGETNCVAFSPNNQVIAGGAKDNAIILINVQTGKMIRALQGHTNWVLSLAFSSNGLFLASGSGGRDVFIWDLSAGKIMNTLLGHKNSVVSVAFSPDGNLLATGSRDKTVKLWNTSTENTPAKSQNLLQSIFRTRTMNETVVTLADHKDSVWTVAFSPNSRILATGSRDHSIILWDSITGRKIQELSGHTDWVKSLDFDPSGHFLASGGNDNLVIIWNVSNGKLEGSFPGHDDNIVGIKYINAGKRLVSCSLNGSIIYWDSIN